MSRKLTSFKWTIWSVLVIQIAYFVMIAYTDGAVDSNIVLLALACVGGDAIAMKAANAIGDHGALKKGTTPSA